ncbi:MAG: HIT family protein [Candidatus Bathyarchaeota archaeon]|nr:HIT family protein [Candidatus Bathyarchaeum tardum]WGM89860.1 MAG: HIT family protein [Candidatus Bathyarchaeum tardum]WNZ30002.1 MAG: HIT family protein [Candidatus Bathyarchaeota archaeon]
MDAQCPFCNIASGAASASIVYEDSNVLAFMDLNPISVGHMLIISREHWTNLYDVPEGTLNEMIVIVKRVAVALKKAFGCDGIRIIQNNERSAGQVVMHIHFHVIPTFAGQKPATRNLGRVRQNRKELDETAQKIRENL